MYRIAAIAMATLLASGNTYAQNSVDCSSAVTPNGSSLELSADQGNDTENLQCALDKAVVENFASVNLVDSSYSIGAVVVSGFEGALTGKSIRATTLNIEADTVDCSADDAGALTFYAGNPSVSNMTINVGELCGQTGETASVLAFASNADNCDERTLNANVNRIALVGPGSSGTDVLTGVTMTNADACDSKVLGTLKVNRSDISGMAVGVVSSVGGAGQVDINFNTFSDMGTSIAILNANQGTSIAGNTVNFNDVASYASVAELGNVGIFIGGDAGSPSSNLSSLKNNKFFNGGASEDGYGVLIGQLENKISHSVWISGNQFTGLEVSADSSGSAQAADADGPSNPVEFSSGFEETENLVEGTGPLVGWRAYINVFGQGCSAYSYGYEYQALGSGVAAIADGASSKVLNVYSDYDNPESTFACLESNVFREYQLTAGNIGTYTFSYDVELPPEEFRGADAVGFIKVLDPDNGYADIGGVTPVASTEGSQQLEITLTDAMVGKLLQFGFATTADSDAPSGMYYDNAVFQATGGGGSGGSSSPAGGSGYGVAATNTDGVLVSGNRFADGATAWIATDAVGLGNVTGWSIVDNTFKPSKALADISLGGSTASAVVGRDQDTPRVLDDGSNDVLQGTGGTGDTETIATDVDAVFSALWSFLTEQ